MTNSPSTHPAVPTHPASKGLSIAALVVGLVGLILGPIGILTGIVAIILAIVSLTKTHDGKKGLAIGGLVAGFFSIVGGIIISFLVGFIFSHGISYFTNQMNQNVQAQIEQKKEFREGETAKIGNLDYTVTSTERDHTLTTAESKMCMPTSSLDKKKFADSDAQYVAVKATYSYNGDAELGEPNISQIRLNDIRACYTAETITNGADENSIEYIYRVPKDSPTLVQSTYITVYTASPNGIFGSEGLPSENFIYTITLK